jgi:hypothetical protein
MNTIYGVAADRLGHAANEQGAWSTRADLILNMQDERIGIDLDHRGPWVGEIIYLERSRSRDVWLVGHVDDAVLPETRVRLGPDEVRTVPTPMYWSLSRIGDEVNGYVIQSVALTTTPARIAATPVTFCEGDVSLAAYRASGRQKELLQRAAKAHLRKRPEHALHIRNLPLERALTTADPEYAWQLAENENARRQPIEHWPASRGSILRIS